MKIKRLIKDLLGERNVGRLEYLLKPELRGDLGGAFNGQDNRKRILSTLINRVPFKAIVETGTYRGATSAFLCQFGLPIYTVEINPRFFAFAALRLRQHRALIHMYEGDSPGFLRELAKNDKCPKSDVFFYLDAHCEEYLPLRDELEIIFNNWSNSVVMVDDFEVPGSEYCYDDYGPGQVLNMTYLEPLRHLETSCFFPLLDPQFETGRKRGCVVLCRENSVKSVLSGIETLTPETRS
jgi:predicted O-methyltransferase YrrM